MTSLFVYYDARCNLCVTLARWLEAQSQIVPLLCLPKDDGVDDLVVEADSGELWRGDSAWIIVIWALAEYRAWANRLASPALLPFARQAFAALSAHRAGLSRWLRLGSSDRDMAAVLAEVSVPECRL